MSDVELRVEMVFDSVKKVRMVVQTWLLRNEWFFKVLISNAKRFIYRYKDKDYSFILKINVLSKETRFIKLIHYTYFISIHDKWRGRSSIVVISKDPLNIVLFVDNLKTKPA